MPRAALIATGLLLAATMPLQAGMLDPHMDPSRVPDGCAACHRGHGLARSPMLAAPQTELCLSCHDDAAMLGAARLPALEPTPQPLSRALSQPYLHPLSDTAFSRYEPGAVTCTSCHSPHRGMRRPARSETREGRVLTSPRHPERMEYQLCQECHGGLGVTTRSPRDLSRLLNPNNRSYHPVEAPAAESSPSVRAALAGRQINCTDCHGNSDPSGPRGPHGSAVRHLLTAEYTVVDGAAESARSYGLCYSCHERGKVLDSSTFPEHRLHVVEQRASCSTCHDPHGSPDYRALIRFGDESELAAVTASPTTGELAFVSPGPGSGACYLTCHGRDHAPETYGSRPSAVDTMAVTTRSAGSAPRARGTGSAAKPGLRRGGAGR